MREKIQDWGALESRRPQLRTVRRSSDRPTDFLRERVREVRDRPTDYWLGGDEREARGALSAAGDFFRNSKVRGTDRPTIGWVRAPSQVDYLLSFQPDFLGRL